MQALISITPPVNTVNGKVVINFAGGGTNFSCASRYGLEKQKDGNNNISIHRKKLNGGKQVLCLAFGDK